MKRLFLLLLLVIPYWMWLNPSKGSPHLAFDSLVPFAYALCSLAVFVPAGWWLFDLDYDERLESVSRISMGSIGGIALVYALGAATASPILIAKVLGGWQGIVFGVIGLGNSLKDITVLPLWVSILGYTLGVGLIEEVAKAFAARSDIIDGIRSRAAFGFVAGIGFGVAEALLYSYRDYAGKAEWMIYVIRFVFCVGFHGCMSAIAVLCLPEDWWDRDQWIGTGLRLLPIASLHGTYDALLGRNCPVWAGIIATVTILSLPFVLWWKEEFAGEA